MSLLNRIILLDWLYNDQTTSPAGFCDLSSYHSSDLAWKPQGVVSAYEKRFKSPRNSKANSNHRPLPAAYQYDLADSLLPVYFLAQQQLPNPHFADSHMSAFGCSCLLFHSAHWLAHAFQPLPWVMDAARPHPLIMYSQNCHCNLL